MPKQLNLVEECEQFMLCFEAIIDVKLAQLQDGKTFEYAEALDLARKSATLALVRVMLPFDMPKPDLLAKSEKRA